MLLSRPSSWLFTALLFSVANYNAQSIDPITIVIGEDSAALPSSVGWTDGVCYKPMTNGVHPGDSLEFRYYAHDVHIMASKEHFMSCDFTDATLLSQVGQAPFRYRIPADQTDTIYFACSVGDHCASGTQKLQVMVFSILGDTEQERPATVSSYLTGTSTADCQKLQESPEEELVSDQQPLSSECSDPVLGGDGHYTRTCLSGPATLTPGGVINRLFVLQYPFPRDHRVAIGQRTFEFVHDNIDGEGVIPVPVNQLYVHHLSGNVIFGQGSEGLRQEAPDAPFAQPYALMSGDEGDSMIFHIIDLRQVDDWLACIECRCRDSGMTYMDELANSGNLTGGVNCCTNCTDLAGPTLDYRMRYNISYQELDDEEPIKNVEQLLADISPAVGKVLEHDVPSYQYLPEDQRDEENKFVQYLERVEPFNKLFKEGFFERDYSGTGEVQLIRCVAHLHVAAIDMWLEDVETGQRLCDGETTYGKDPATDEGFLIAVSVDNHDPPLTFPADRMVRFVTRYDATYLHTGVMGYYFIFLAGEESLTRKQVNMTVDLCLQSACDASMLPVIDMEPFRPPPSSANTVTISIRQADNDNEDCVDTLTQNPACIFGGLCECEAFVNAPESSGCNGFYTSPMGNIEVRSVCAKYCGCDMTATIEEAAAEEDCVDALADSPSCTFGRLCDCEVFVNSPASSGCNGVYSSAMGDIEVRSVCAKYCGCEGESETGMQPEVPISSTDPPPTILGCVDKLSQNPICRFGNICECKDFVNAPESEGCGGSYKSSRGDIVINDVCAQYCDACEERSVEELFEEAYTEVLTLKAQAKCHYATAECKAMLSNMYSCGSGQSGIEKAHPMIQAVVTKQGQKVALASAQLGHPSLHAGEELQQPSVCALDAFDIGEISENSTSSAGQKGSLRMALITMISTSSMLLLWW